MEQYWCLVSIMVGLVNFWLVVGIQRFSSRPVRWKRALLAGLIGTLQAAACGLPGFSFLAEPHWRMIGLVLAALVAFGMNLQALPMGAVFTVIHLSVDAFAAGNVWPLVLLGGLLVLLHYAGKRGRGNYAVITIQHGTNTVRLRALVDTGNTLKDPVTGREVIVVDCDAARELLGLDPDALARPVETLAGGYFPGLRLIPYSSIGQPAGFLLGLRVDRILVNGELVERIVAFAPQQIGQGGSYQALLGGTV